MAANQTTQIWKTLMSRHTCSARLRLPFTFSLRPGCRRWQLAHGALLTMLAGTALAAEPADPHDHAAHTAAAYELAPMVITGVAQQSPLTVVTDPKIPRQPMPASDGADYLKTIPGFSAVRNGGVNGDPVFRGMFGSRLKLLSNGGEMLGACPNRMDSPSSYISPDTYDKLTVIKGPQTVLWGPGASAATVLFEREPEQFSEPDYRLNGSLLAASNGRFDRNLDAAAGNAQGYARLMANSSQADDYADGNGDTVPSRYDKWNSDVALGWTPDDDTLLELTVGRGDGEARYAGRGMDGSQFKRESAALRFERTNLGEVLQKIEARIYYNYADHVMDNFSLRRPSGTGMMANPMAANVDRRTLGGRLAATWQWDDYSLVSGVDAQRNEHRQRSSRYDMMTGTYTAHEQFAWNRDADFHNYGVFGELTRTLDDDNRVIGGARLDHATAQDYRRTGPSAGDSRSDNLPSGFMRYEHDLQSLPATAYVGLGHAERFPDYWELFSGGASAFSTVKPEKTTQLDVGLQYSQGPLDAWASAYVGQVRDFILFSYGTNMMGMSRSSADNVDARIMGGELGATYRLNANWKTDASLAYAWGKNSSDGEALPQMPPLEGRLGLGYERGDWSAAGLWRLVAAQTRVAEGKGNVVSKDFDESAGFGVFSLNGAYRLNRNLKLSTGIDNLLDKAYSEHLNLAGNAGFGLSADERINEPGRTYWARVDLSF